MAQRMLVAEVHWLNCRMLGTQWSRLWIIEVLLHRVSGAYNASFACYREALSLMGSIGNPDHRYSQLPIDDKPWSRKRGITLSGPTKKLDQVYCAWLIKWVVKWEIFKLTELCLTRWWIISGTRWYWVSIWRYRLVLDQYKLVLLGLRWYRVSKGLLCRYILEKWRFGGVLPIPDSQTDNRR